MGVGVGVCGCVGGAISRVVGRRWAVGGSDRTSPSLGRT